MLTLATVTFSFGGAIVGLILGAIVYLLLAWLLPRTALGRNATTIAAVAALIVFLLCAFDVSGSIST